MRRLSKLALALAFAALLIVGGGAYALGSSRSQTITVCVKHKGGTLYQSRRCAKRDGKLSWNAQDRPTGSQSVPGATGPQGPRGNAGPQGPAGATGAQGPAGSQGLTGDRGPSDAFSVGNGSSSGSAPPLDLAVPAGDYFVTAKAVLSTNSSSELDTRCDLTGGTDPGGVASDDVTFGSLDLGTHSQETLVATLVTHFAAPGKIHWSCSSASFVGDAVVNAVQVGSIH